VVHPSGGQHVISWEDQEATIVGVGGGLRHYEADGRQVLDGYGPDEMCPDARGQALVPWPGRLRDGRYRFRGQVHQLPLSEPERANAIHGLVRWSSWAPGRREPAALTMVHRLHPQPGYPFLLDLGLTYRLSDEGLRAEFLVENRGTTAAPLGVGQRPCLLPLAGRLGDTVLEVPARSYLAADGRGIPSGRRPVAGGRLDFRAPRRLGELALDAVFTDLERDRDGTCSVRLRAGGRSLRVWMDERFACVLVCTGDTLPPSRRRRSLAVEPMTCPPNALASGEDVAVLEPGERWAAAWGIQLTPLHRARGAASNVIPLTAGPGPDGP
jgi:aldose 1-epimerase